MTQSGSILTKFISYGRKRIKVKVSIYKRKNGEIDDFNLAGWFIQTGEPRKLIIDKTFKYSSFIA